MTLGGSSALIMSLLNVACFFNVSGFCNSPKASVASKKTLNLSFSIPQWGAGFPSISDPFFVICLAPFLGFICATFWPSFGFVWPFMGSGTYGSSLVRL
jgi:hypothetical protein